MKRIRLACCVLVVCCAVGTAVLLMGAQKKAPKLSFGMFSWDKEAMEEEEAKTLAKCIKQAGVKMVYQEFPVEDLRSGEAAAFVKRLRRQSVEVYALFGGVEWARDKQGETIIKMLKEVSLYNKSQSSGARITGVMVDVEPYLLDEWDEGREARKTLMKNYLQSMEAAYDKAGEYGLKMWVCIPNFYDAGYVDILEALIAEACDGVAVMNYDRTDEYMQMAREVGFAREYGKGVLCIYELQEPGMHELKEINTYASVGLEALWESAQRLDKQFGYDRLQFAYHYYSPLQKLLEQGE